jgi:hypothetical protein
MEMNHIPGAQTQNFVDGVAFEQGQASLLGQQGRERFPGAAELVANHIRMLGEGYCRLGGMQEMIGIYTVNDIDMMPFVGQRVREAVNLDGIAAKSVRRVKCREVKEIQRPAQTGQPFRTASFQCKAASSQSFPLSSAMRP